MNCCVQAALLVLVLTAQNDSASLIGVVDDRPELSIPSAPARYAGDALADVLGQDLEIVGDYGVIAVTEFRVDTPQAGAAVRLSEMIDSAAAFGLFSYIREWRESDYGNLALGAEGFFGSGRVVFWQSRFVVELDGSRDPSLAIGRALSDAITGSSRKPTVSMLLPARGLIADSERYIVTPAVLGEIPDLDSDLLFQNDAEVAAAEYQEGDETATLVLFSYPTPQIARIRSEAWMDSRETPMPTRRAGLLFGIVTSTSSSALADSILSDLQSQFDLTYVPPSPDPITIQQIILTAFTWIGIALLFTVAAGLGFGGLRIYMKTRDTNSILGLDHDEEFVQLNINQPLRTNKPAP